MLMALWTRVGVGRVGSQREPREWPFLGPSLSLAPAGGRWYAQSLPSGSAEAQSPGPGEPRTAIGAGAKRPPLAQGSRETEAGARRGGEARRPGQDWSERGRLLPWPRRRRSGRWAGRRGSRSLFRGAGPAPAPTGAHRVQECSGPDSPAPPSYLPPPHKAVPPLPAARPRDSPALRAPAAQPPCGAHRGEGGGR